MPGCEVVTRLAGAPMPGCEVVTRLAGMAAPRAGVHGAVDRIALRGICLEFNQQCARGDRVAWFAMELP